MTVITRTQFDAVIIGAGPAGATAAILLARAGWAVALVERQRFPRRKVCGECIAASNMPLLQRLGVGDVIAEQAGRELRHVTLLHREHAVSAALPVADHDRFAWGRAFGRETLDTMLLEQASQAGATVFQPWLVQTLEGIPGAWHCTVRASEGSASAALQARLVIDAHGSWESLPTARPARRLSRSTGDLFAFKANFRGAALAEDGISVLALAGGYGGMVVADQQITTLACCIRRDRLSGLRAAATSARAGEVAEAWLQRECAGVRDALRGAVRLGPWLGAGPLDPGVRVAADAGIFKIGNAAGEAHPILGEGISMALQSAALLCAHLLGTSREGATLDGAEQIALQQRYVAAWRTAFTPRLRLAAGFAYLAMRPHTATMMVKLLQVWPGLLTQGARWGGKVRSIEPGIPIRS